MTMTTILTSPAAPFSSGRRRPVRSGIASPPRTGLGGGAAERAGRGHHFRQASAGLWSTELKRSRESLRSIDRRRELVHAAAQAGAVGRSVRGETVDWAGHAPQAPFFGHQRPEVSLLSGTLDKVPASAKTA